MEKGVTGYLIFKIILGFLILTNDLIIGVKLLCEYHLLWGLLTLVWVFTGFLFSFIGTTIGRFRTGDSMSCMKFLLLCMKIHAELVGAFFHSGPQIITQLAIFWSGTYGHDFEVYGNAGTLSWMFAWLEISSIVLNVVSLTATGIYVCNEPGPVFRKIWSQLSILSTGLYRVFVLSIIFKLSPLISLGVVSLLYLITAVVYRLSGDGAQSIVFGYFSMYFPCGYNNMQGGKPGVIAFSSGVPEMERSRINQEGMVKRVQKYLGTQLFISLSLLVPYLVFSEVWLFTPNHEYQTSPILEQRLFVYLTAFILLLLSIVSYLIFFIQCVQARAAARTWTGLTPAKSLLSSVTDTSLPNSTSLRISGPSTTASGPASTAFPPPSRPSTASTAFPPSPRPTTATTSFPPHAGGAVEPAPPYFDQRPQTWYGDQQVPQSPGRPTSVLYPYLPTAPEEAGIVRPRPLPPGNRKCDNDECVTCAWMIEGPHFFSTVTNKKYRFMTSVTCRDTSIIYLVTCRSCRKQYVGKTQQSLRERHYGHRREIDQLSSHLGKHFGEVCGIESWRIQIIDKCSPHELKRREAHWMHELSSLAPVGLNIRDEAGGGGVAGSGDIAV